MTPAAPSQSLHRFVEEFVAIVAATPPDTPGRSGVVAFESDDQRLAVDLARGTVVGDAALLTNQPVPPDHVLAPSTSSTAHCTLRATPETLWQLLRGATTMQSAFVGGALQLRGEPAGLLSLSQLFEVTATVYRA